MEIMDRESAIIKMVKWFYKKDHVDVDTSTPHVWEIRRLVSQMTGFNSPYVLITEDAGDGTGRCIGVHLFPDAAISGYDWVYNNLVFQIYNQQFVDFKRLGPVEYKIDDVKIQNIITDKIHKDNYPDLDETEGKIVELMLTIYGLVSYAMSEEFIRHYEEDDDCVDI